MSNSNQMVGTVSGAVRLAGNDYAELDTVGRWIKWAIRPGYTVFAGDSDWLNRQLTHYGDVELTGDQFRKTMLLAGYKPADPKAPVWHYCLTLNRELNYNPNPFVLWALQFKDEESARGEFIDDVTWDRDFPIDADYRLMRNYLEHIGASQESLNAFEELWGGYGGEQKKQEGRTISEETRSFFSTHSIDEMTAVGVWLQRTIKPSSSDTFRDDNTSYELRQLLDRSTGVHLSNDDFKRVMLLAGYAPVNRREYKWRYYIDVIRSV